MTRFSDLLATQLDLQRNAFGIDPTMLVGDQRMEYIRWNVLALTDELHEMLAETGWKPWASSAHVNEDLALDELVDALHFLLNLLLVVGQPLGDAGLEDFTNQLMSAYMRKVEVNAQRQVDGYSGTHKCPDCHRDLATVKPVVIEDSDGRARQACPCGKVLPA